MAIEQEYKRKCRQCGKVWHSLVAREKKLSEQLSSSKTDEKCDSVPCCGDDKRRLQAQGNRQSTESELEKIRRCPDCSSKDYEQEIVSIQTP